MYLSYKRKINNMQIYIIFHMEHLREIMIFLFVQSYYEPETSSNVLINIMIFLFVQSYYEPETSSDVLINKGNA
jgi:hypothetical protein